MTRRITEVAKKAGVSEATVSRVLNGRQGVAAATRETVLTALDVLGYERPTKLRGERARMVGLVLPELQNPIFPAFAEVVAGSLAQRGFIPALCARTVGGVAESDYVDMLLEHQVSGVIFAGGAYSHRDAEHDHYRRFEERGLPVVLINAGVPSLRFPRISTDDVMAAEQAYHHLVSLGHERIGMVLGTADHLPSERKLAGMRAAAERAGRPIADADVEGVVERASFSMESARAAAGRLIERGITGIVCASDVMALGVVRAARRMGRRVPEDVSVIGFDDSAFMTCTDPPLTTIRQPIETMGQTAVDILARLIGGDESTVEELLFEPELVVRGSTARIA